MTTADIKLIYEFNDIQSSTPVGDRTINIDSTTLNSDNVTLTNNTSYYFEVIILSSNGIASNSGSARFRWASEKSAGVLSLVSSTTSEFFTSTSSQFAITRAISGNNFQIILSTAQNTAGQNSRVLVNVKAFGV